MKSYWSSLRTCLAAATVLSLTILQPVEPAAARSAGSVGRDHRGSEARDRRGSKAQDRRGAHARDRRGSQAKTARVGKLAGRHKDISRRQHTLANRLDAAVGRGAVRRAGGLTDRMQRLSRQDGPVVVRETHLSEGLGRTHDLIARGKALQRQQQRTINQLDYRLEQGKAGSFAERLADRLRSISHRAARLAALVDHRLSGRGQGSGGRGTGGGTGGGGAGGGGTGGGGTDGGGAGGGGAGGGGTGGGSPVENPPAVTARAARPEQTSCGRETWPPREFALQPGDGCRSSLDDRDRLPSS